MHRPKRKTFSLKSRDIWTRLETLTKNHHKHWHPRLPLCPLRSPQPQHHPWLLSLCPRPHLLPCPLLPPLQLLLAWVQQDRKSPRNNRSTDLSQQSTPLISAWARRLREARRIQCHDCRQTLFLPARFPQTITCFLPALRLSQGRRYSRRSRQDRSSRLHTALPTCIQTRQRSPRETLRQHNN